MGKFADFMFGGGIGAATSLLGSGINAIATGIQNRKNRQWADRNWNREVANQWKMWRAMNEYNDPSAQMARLKAAGLNPALMYGGSGKEAGAASVGSPSADQVTGQVPDLSGISNSVDEYYNMKIKEQTKDNMKEQKNLIAAQVLNQAANTQKTISDTKLTKDNTRRLNNLEQINHQIAVEALGKTKEEIQTIITQRDIAKRQDIRDAHRLANTLLNDKIGRQNTKSIMEHREVQKEIDEFKRNMWSEGRNPSHPAYQQALSVLLNELIDRFKTIDMSKVDLSKPKNLWKNWQKNQREKMMKDYEANPKKKKLYFNPSKPWWKK